MSSSNEEVDDLCAHENKFFNYIRMSKSSLYEFLNCIREEIIGQDTKLIRSIPAEEKLVVTLRNLLEQDLENMVAVEGQVFCVVLGIRSPRVTDVLGYCHDEELNSVRATYWVFFIELHHEDIEELQHLNRLYNLFIYTPGEFEAIVPHGQGRERLAYRMKQCVASEVPSRKDGGSRIPKKAFSMLQEEGEMLVVLGFVGENNSNGDVTGLPAQPVMLMMMIYSCEKHFRLRTMYMNEGIYVWHCVASTRRCTSSFCYESKNGFYRAFSQKVDLSGIPELSFTFYMIITKPKSHHARQFSLVNQKEGFPQKVLRFKRRVECSEQYLHDCHATNGIENEQ
ncbi:hypothetical protein ANN_09270 [Periplaneta americana]|uniref:Uncharacterized protein n=1 Tax=Periplaneta americana TaxID=6978 RepID=A0ABQ8TKX6_PERAM|nr:hypothetical protein ANN_09270 [Periplaneta americana]